LFVLYFLLVLPQGAEGLQFYFFFDIPYSEGGTASQYFTGSPRYKLYDCRVCHVNAPGLIRVDLWTEPVDIFQVGYSPNAKYTVYLELEKELHAPPRKLFSTNNFCLEVLDSSGRNAGSFDLGFPWNKLTQLIDPIVLSPDGTTVEAGFFNFDLQFHWFWTAPGPGSGSVTFYCGFVDGNGDLKAFGDDVAVLKQGALEIP
jgi:hypothetical protein